MKILHKNYEVRVQISLISEILAYYAYSALRRVVLECLTEFLATGLVVKRIVKLKYLFKSILQ